MYIVLPLNSSPIVLHREVITLPETVEIGFSSCVYALGEIVVTINGKQYKTSGENTIDISEHFTQAGEVEIMVSLIARGEAVKSWSVEKFIVKEVDGTYKAIPEIESLKERVLLLEKASQELKTLINS